MHAVKDNIKISTLIRREGGVMGGVAVKKRYIVNPAYKEECKNRYRCCAAMLNTDGYDIDINGDDNDDRWLFHWKSMCHLSVDSKQSRKIVEENVAYLSQANKL